MVDSLRARAPRPPANFPLRWLHDRSMKRAYDDETSLIEKEVHLELVSSEQPNEKREMAKAQVEATKLSAPRMTLLPN